MNQKEMVDRRIELKTELARIAKHEAKIREELRPLEINILKELHASGFDAVKVGDHTISAKTAIYPTIKNREAAMHHIAEHNMWELLPASILATSYRELIKNGEDVPGVESYEKTTLSVVKR